MTTKGEAQSQRRRSSISWKVPQECRLEWRSFGSLHIVFNPASGDTHLLNAVSAAVLRSLEETPSTIDELQARSNATDVEALIEELDELGLIAPASS